MTKDQLVKELQDAIIESSQTRLGSFCKVEGFELKREKTSVDGTQFRDMVLILLSGAEIHLMLKIFFDSESQTQLIMPTYGELSDRSQVSQYSVDSLKEVANLIAGHLKLMLDQSSIRCEISLPIAMRGYDELFFRDQGVSTDINWCWRLTYKSEPIVFSGILKLNVNRDIEFNYVDETSTLELF